MSNIMIIDDDDDFSNAVAMVIRGAGHRVQIFSTTAAASEAINKDAPDLVVLDVMFPENDSEGFDFARALQKMTQGKQKIPVLMLTAINKKSQVGFSAKDIDDSWLPVDDFVEKPVDFFVLQTKINQLLEKFGSRS